MNAQELIQQAKDAVAEARKADEAARLEAEREDVYRRVVAFDDIMNDLPTLQVYRTWLEVTELNSRTNHYGNSMDYRRACLTLRLPDCDLIWFRLEQSKGRFANDFSKWGAPEDGIRYLLYPDVPDWHEHEKTASFETLPEAIAWASERHATTRAEQGVVRFEPDPVEPDPMVRIADALEAIVRTMIESRPY